MRRVVVLPQPEGPSRQTTSPASTARSTASTATSWSKRLVTLSSSMSAIRSSEEIFDDVAEHRKEQHDRRGHEPARLTVEPLGHLRIGAPKFLMHLDPQLLDLAGH